MSFGPMWENKNSIQFITQSIQDGSRPKELPGEGGDEQETAHAGAVLDLKGVQHGDVTLRAHRFGKEEAT